MNAKKFSDAMSELDTKYVDEALNYKKKAGKKKKKQNWTKWGAMAACLKDDAICIVKVNGTYQFYVKEGVERTEQNNIPDIIIDAPVDEDTYHEVGSDTPAEYGTGHDDMETSNGTITLEYITELQAKVSTAMSNGELQFVSSSAVYENPYRLHIIVTSNAETDLSKLKAFDTIGGALEIEYDANHISAVEEILTE